MTQFLEVFLMTLLYIGYLAIDAKEDSVLIREKGGVDHKWNWALRAITGIVASYGLYSISWLTVGYALFLMGLSWPIFDALINLHLGKHPFKYVGSGDIDKFFKEEYDNPSKALLIAKGIVLAICLTMYLIILF